MQKIWHIKINSHTEGPYSFNDLKNDRRITPDTLVWKVGYKEWKPIRDIPELKDLFFDENEPPSELEKPDFKGSAKSPGELFVLEMGQEPPYLFWILVAATILIYVLSQLYLK